MSTYKVYRRVHRLEERCPNGDTHSVTYYDVKFLTDTGATYRYNNGYEIRDEKIWTDAQGRLYFMRHTVDYSQNTSLKRTVDDTMWRPYLDHNARDTSGRPLTKHTPPGPPLNTLLVYSSRSS